MKKYQIESVLNSTGNNNVIYTIVDDQEKVARSQTRFGSSVPGMDLEYWISDYLELSIKVCAIANYLRDEGFSVVTHYGIGQLSGLFFDSWNGESEIRENIPAQILSKEEGFLAFKKCGISKIETEMANLEEKILQLPFIHNAREFQALYCGTDTGLKLMDFDTWEVDPRVIEEYRVGGLD